MLDLVTIFFVRLVDLRVSHFLECCCPGLSCSRGVRMINLGDFGQPGRIVERIAELAGHVLSPEC